MSQSEDNSQSDDTGVVKVKPTITTHEKSSNPFDEEITQTCPSDSIEQRPQSVVNDDLSSAAPRVVEHEMQNLTVNEPVESVRIDSNAEDAAVSDSEVADHDVSEIAISIRDYDKQDGADEVAPNTDDVVGEERTRDDECGKTDECGKSDEGGKTAPEDDAQHPPITPRRRIHAVDENGNVPCVKSKPRRNDLLSEMPCNGKAVMV